MKDALKKHFFIFSVYFSKIISSSEVCINTDADSDMSDDISDNNEICSKYLIINFSSLFLLSSVSADS